MSSCATVFGTKLPIIFMPVGMATLVNKRKEPQSLPEGPRRISTVKVSDCENFMSRPNYFSQVAAFPRR